VPRCVRSKYRVLERSIIPKAAGLREKIPEQEKTLEMIQFLKKKHVRAVSSPV